MLIGEVVGEAGFLEGGDRSWFILSFSRKFLGVMVNRMVFFYVYVIAERFTSDFGESLLPVLFSPTEPKNTPMIHDLILEEQKKERGCAVNLLTTQPLFSL